MYYFVVGETVQWGRDCYTPDDGYIGCRQEDHHGKPADVCYCEGDLCNAKMEDISTTSSPKPTTQTTAPTTTHKGIYDHCIEDNLIYIILSKLMSLK